MKANSNEEQKTPDRGTNNYNQVDIEMDNYQMSNKESLASDSRGPHNQGQIKKSIRSNSYNQNANQNIDNVSCFVRIFGCGRTSVNTKERSSRPKKMHKVTRGSIK